MPRATIITWTWYSSCEISSAAASLPSYSAAIQTSAASSTTFLPMAWTPLSTSSAVREVAGSPWAALCWSSVKSSSNVFLDMVVLTLRGDGDCSPPGFGYRTQAGRGRHRRGDRLVPLVLAGAGQSGAVQGLFLVVTGEQTEADG